MFVQNQWYIAALEREIGEQPFARKICGEPIVFFRTSKGELAALPDRCPHRQVPLSKGCVGGDNIQCAYHGMQFSPLGKCVHIPSQAVIPERAHLQHYPLAQQHGLVWVWIGKEPATRLPDITEFADLSSDKHAGAMLHAHAHTDYRLGVDNFLDASHVLFVHPNTVASEAVTAAKTEMMLKEDEVRVRRTMPGEACSPMFKAILKVDTIDRVQDSVFRPVDHTWIETTVTLPGVLNGPVIKTRTFGLFTPETESTCHLWAGMYRNFGVGNEQLDKLVAQQIQQTIDEDVRICEEVQRNWDDSVPVTHLVVDKACLAARQILRNLGESRPAAAAAASASFRQLEADDDARAR